MSAKDSMSSAELLLLRMPVILATVTEKKWASEIVLDDPEKTSKKYKLLT